VLDLGCRVDVEVRECFSSPEILESKAQCEPARYRRAAPSRLQCPFGLAGPVFEVVVVTHRDKRVRKSDLIRPYTWS